MKRLLLLTPFLIALQLIAARPSNVHIKHYHNLPIVVELDGHRFGPANDKVTIKDVPAGRHQVRIFELISGPHNWYPSERLLISKNVFIPGGRNLFAEVSPKSISIIQSLAIFQEPLPAPIAAAPICHSNPVIQPMAPDDFAHLKHVLQDQWFDNTRKDILLHELDQHFFTSYQIRELLDVFSFERNRLEIAKAAYTSTLDNERYYVIYEAFAFSSSVNRLIDYISHTS